VKLKSILSAMAVGAALMLGGLSAARAETPADQLIIGLSMVNILSMDPGQSGGAEADVIRANLYDRLVQLDATDLTVQPQIATSWTVSEDGRIVTFKLRTDAKFQSGNPVTSDDVVWSLRRLVDEDLSGGARLRGLGFSSENSAQNIRNPDATTFEIELGNRLNPDILLALLAENSLSIIDSKLAMEHETDGDQGGAWLATNSAGSGPYALTKWEPSTIVLLERNDAYWDGAAKMTRIVFRHMPESQTQRLSLERGDIDIALQLSASDLEALEARDDVKISLQPDGGFYFWAVSEEKEMFRDPRVREAIRHLVDYEGINNTVLRYYGTLWEGPLAPNRQAALPSPHWTFDPVYAKQLLTEAGYPDGFDTTLRVLSDAPLLDIAVSVQNTLAQGGIRAEIISGGGSVVYDKMRERDFEMVVGRGGITTPHPDAMSSILYNPDNSPDAKLYSQQSWRTSSFNPSINLLLEAARAETDPDIRTAYYEDVQRLFHAKIPAWQPISAAVNAMAYRADLTDFVIHPTRTTRLTAVSKAR
jgi:peptide/nickel transport system substrate-binding protein